MAVNAMGRLTISALVNERNQMMKRRSLLAVSVAALAATALPAIAGGGHVEYSRATYDAAIASGEPFMLDFYASW